MSLVDFQKKIGAKPDGDFGKETLTKGMIYLGLTKEQAAHFFAQVGHETGGFKLFTENLAYSEERMLSVFKSDFDTNKDRVLSPQEKLKAKELKGKPQAIANFVYANQNGNGNEASGDGWKFRGRGALQLTGRANYQNFANFLGKPEIVENPDLVTTEFAFESATYFFTRRKLWPLCRTVDNATILQVTKLINGGTNGLEDRKALTKKYYALLNQK